MNEKISIIIPVYNTKKYLKKCIESVLNQTYQNLEIICVDDGSTDGSAEVLDIYAKLDSRLKVIHKVNEGVSAARNDGLKIATGDWIGFIDSDDYILEQMYETMMSANKKELADVIACGYYMVYGENAVLAANMKPVPDKAIETKKFFKYMYERDIYKGVASYLWTRLIARDLLYDKDGNIITEFAIDLELAEDLVFLAEVLQRSKTSLYVKTPLYCYLQRENSACHDERKQLERLSWVRAYQRILEIFDENPIDEDIYNLIVRMLVYRCGKTMEIAKNYQDWNRYNELKMIAEKYYSIYEKVNTGHLERQEWIKEILNKRR